jgi:arsenite methyltransferase
MSETISDAVRKGYGTVAQSGLSSDQGNIKGIANAFGYSDEELASIPAEANMGLSCGNPIAIASIKEGETVVDLGAGGGLDVFLASKSVGPNGMAIGIDMTGDMVSLARKNAEKGGYDNVKFYLAEIEAMPLQDNSVDCVISNCVLNLCADKDVALAEVFRVLKPGGRFAISDIALRKVLPEAIKKEVAAWTGCIAGALSINENREALLKAGFSQIDIQDSNSDLNAYKDGGHAACCGPDSEADMSGGGCCGSEPAPEPEPEIVEESGFCCGECTDDEKTDEQVASDYHDTMSDLLDEFDVNEYAASVKIFALKPE